MTTATNPVSVLEPHQYPQSVVVTSDVAINEGDLVYWDGTNFSLTPLTLATQVAVGGANNSQGFMGVALGSSQPVIYGGDPALPGVPVLGHGCVFVQTTNAETYNHFNLVTVGADAQTITKSGANAANSVGIVIIDPPALGAPRPHQATPAPETVVGAAGVRVRIQLTPKHSVGLVL